MSLPPETELSNQMPWVEGTTRVFGVIAHPVDHVRAPMVFNPRFAAALADAKIGKLTIANRSLGKAEELVSLLASKTGFANAHAAALIDCDGGDADMIINSTSLGLKLGDPLPLVLDAVRPDTVIADIIMVPAKTEWLVAAQKVGLRVHYGRHMLDYQIDLIGKFIGAL